LQEYYGFKKAFPIFIFVMVASVFMLLYLNGSLKAVPKPVNGVLNLEKWDGSKGRPSLAGEWEFYWNRLYTYGDFASGLERQMQYVYVPKTWNSYTEDGKSLPGFGYATYRLKVVVGDTQPSLSLRLDTMSTAYRLFVNENEVASNGVVGTDRNISRPFYMPEVVEFQPPGKEFFLIVQVSNYTYARGGIWYEINMGTREQIDRLNRIILYKDALLIGSLLIMALYYASFYIVLQRDKSSMYFMLLCLIFIVRTALYGDMCISRIFPRMPFGFLIFLTYTTLYWITIVIFLMVDGIYGNRCRFDYKKIFIAYGIAGTLLTAVLPIHIYTAFITGIEVIGVAMMIFSVGIVARAYRKGERGAGLILLAVSAILAAGIHDVLYQANVIHHSFGEMASVGIFLFMYTFSFIIASRLSDAYDQSRKLSGRLAASLEKEKVATDELVKTELSFLKAQIRPHFIYNTLGVIAAMTTEEPQRAKELLYDLTDYLRGSFHFENYNGMTPLADELETVKAYVSIEKARFQDKLRVEYDIDEKVSVLVPLLTIQPIVENAVRHGVFVKPEGGRVVLSVFREGNWAVIRVEDDGIGIPDSTVEEILKGSGSSRGVGLKNINRRLTLFYGRGLEIWSEEGKGTSVTIRIPREGGVQE
jgi:hypothetical protein